LPAPTFLSAVDGELLVPESKPLPEKLADPNLLGMRRVKRLRKGEYELIRVAVESAMPLSATHLAIIDYLGSVSTARTANIIAATGRPRPAINCALADLVYTKEKVAWPFEAPPYMRWNRRRSGCALLARIPLKNGKFFNGSLPADPERAKVHIARFIRQLIRDGQLDRQSKVAKRYLP
jgi:hypothetical protein